MSASRDEDADSLTGLLGQLMILGAGKDGRGMPAPKHRGTGGSSGGGGAAGGGGGGVAGVSWTHSKDDQARLKAADVYFKTHPSGKNTDARKRHTQTRADHAVWQLHSPEAKRLREVQKQRQERSLETARLKNKQAEEVHNRMKAANDKLRRDMQRRHTAEMQRLDSRPSDLYNYHQTKENLKERSFVPAPYTPEASPGRFTSESEREEQRARHARWDRGQYDHQQSFATMKQTHHEEMLDLHHEIQEQRRKLADQHRRELAEIPHYQQR